MPRSAMYYARLNRKKAHGIGYSQIGSVFIHNEMDRSDIPIVIHFSILYKFKPNKDNTKTIK